MEPLGDAEWLIGNLPFAIAASPGPMYGYHFSGNTGYNALVTSSRNVSQPG
jgi:hypothetical protein